MALRKNVVALDLGASAIKALSVSVTDAGVQIERALHIQRQELVNDGLEPGNLEQLARMLAARMADQRLSTRGVVLGIGAQDCMMRYTRMPPVPDWRLKVIMEYEAKEMSEKVNEPLASGYRPLQLAREADEDQTVLLGLVKEKPLEAIVDALESAGITVDLAIPNPAALFAAQDAFGRKADPEAQDDDLALLCDLGAESLSIALVLNDRLAFARSVTFGGKAFTEALAQSLGLDLEQAEKSKVARGGLDERESGVHQDSVMPLRGAAGQLLGMLQSSLRVASSQIGVPLPALSRVVLCGGATRLRGLAPFLAQGFGKPVEYFSPQPLRIGASVGQPAARALTERPGDFTVALGLAASRLRDGISAPGRGPMNILPARYAKRREFRDRTVYLYAAGVLLLLLLLGRLGQAIYSNAQAGRLHAELKSTEVKLQELRRELDSTTAAADHRKVRLDRLLKEAEPTAFQAFVLDSLGRVLRPEIQLDTIGLVADDAADEVSFDYRLRIKGRVNNEQRRGLDWILELQSSLQAEDRIGRVDVESSNPDGAWYVFEISVRPQNVSYE